MKKKTNSFIENCNQKDHDEAVNCLFKQNSVFRWFGRRGEARRVHLPGSYQPAGRCVNLCDWIVPALIGAQVRPLPFSTTPHPPSNLHPTRSVQLCRLSMTLALIRHPCKPAESWAALTNYLLCNCELSTFPLPAARWLSTDKVL